MAKQDPDEVEKRLRREAAEEALAEAADKDPQLADWLDYDFEKGMKDVLGMSTSELRKNLEKAIPDITDADVNEAQKAIRDAKRAAKGGFFSGPNPKEAERILMSSRGIREVAKKKSKGCAIIALLMVGGSTATSVGAIWAAAEVLSRVLS